MCLHIIMPLLYALHAGSFPLSEISILALGLTPGLDHPSFHSQVYHRVESRYRTEVRVLATYPPSTPETYFRFTISSAFGEMALGPKPNLIRHQLLRNSGRPLSKATPTSRY